VKLTFEQERMVSEQITPNVQSEPSTLKSAIEAAKAGRRQEAHQLLQQVVAGDPSGFGWQVSPTSPTRRWPR
jgi:hypothetical protein